MAIAIRQYATSGMVNVAATLPCVLGSPVLRGSLLVCALQQRNPSGTVTAPPGFAIPAGLSELVFTGVGGSGGRQLMTYKFADGTEGDTITGGRTGTANEHTWCHVWEVTGAAVPLLGAAELVSEVASLYWSSTFLVPSTQGIALLFAAMGHAGATGTPSEDLVERWDTPIVAAGAPEIYGADSITTRPAGFPASPGVTWSVASKGCMQVVMFGATSEGGFAGEPGGGVW